MPVPQGLHHGLFGGEACRQLGRPPPGECELLRCVDALEEAIAPALDGAGNTGDFYNVHADVEHYCDVTPSRD